MKIRILSGVVMALLVAAVLVLGFLVNSWFISIFLALICAGAAWELLSAFGIRNQVARIGACFFSFLGILLPWGGNINPSPLGVLSVLYVLFAVCMILARHQDFSLAGIAAFTALPLLYCYAFRCLGAVIQHKNGIFFLLLLLNFASVCDMGAYFVGSAFGRHKLCPAISPKKTVEGAMGGIVLSLAVSLILCLCFGAANRWIAWLILTIPFCIIGMMGDLFASSIKRACGIKDYGNLIPGHGGILDRVDSILLIAPVFYLVISAGVLL